LKRTRVPEAGGFTAVARIAGLRSRRTEVT